MDFPERGKVPITGTTETLIVRITSSYKEEEGKKDIENLMRNKNNKRNAKNTYRAASMSEIEFWAFKIWQATLFLELFRGEPDKSSRKKDHGNDLKAKNEKIMKNAC